MKKYFYNIMAMALLATAAISFSSCEDAEIARTLEGTWKGNMYISSSYNGRTYNATYTESTFLKDPGAYSSGNGYWVDYYSDAPWDYVANHIDWTVDFGTIKIYFVEEDTYIRIRDYHLNDDRFYGYLEDGNHDVKFELVHTSSPNWSSYNRWGYNDWYDYYSRTRSDNQSDTTIAEKPIRFVRGK